MVGCRALLPFPIVGRVEMVLGTHNWVKAMEKKGGGDKSWHLGGSLGGILGDLEVGLPCSRERGDTGD